ncbi:unnamed protein product, partial [Cylicostephanus goldi]
MSIPQTKKSDEGHYVCTAVDPQTGASADAPPAHIGVRPASKLEPQVDPIEQSVPQGSPFRIRCWVPGNPHAHLTWRKTEGEINDDSEQNQGILTVNRAEPSDEGDYICTAEDPRTGEEAEAPPATVRVTTPVRPPEVMTFERGPEISPPIQTVTEGDPATIRCWVDGHPEAALSWRRHDGAALPFGASVEDGTLAISSTLMSDEGEYICTYTPPVGPPKESAPSRLNVKPRELSFIAADKCAEKGASLQN